MRFTKIILAGLVALGGLWTAHTDAAEQRCTELSANCVCSEPLNTNVYANLSSWLNPGDSTTKECTVEVFTDPLFRGSAITKLSEGLYGDNNATVLAGLPAGHSVQWYLREPGSVPFSWKVGHAQAQYVSRSAAAAELGNGGVTTHGGVASAYVAVKRFAKRVYVYFSPDFEWQTDHGGACTNGKWGGIDTLVQSMGASADDSHIYNFGWDLDSGGTCAARGLPANCGRFKRDGPSGTNFAPDCCVVGPSGSGDSSRENSSPLNAAGQVITGHQAFRGKWWRFESVVTNRLGGLSPNGYRSQAWIKNITDGWPEQELFDTNGSAFSGAGWAVSANLAPQEIDATGFFRLGADASIYRNGQCNGFMAFSHFMLAQWDTDTGQRIGPAYEIEGGGSLPSTPSPVPNLRIR